jgi:hypothetical protein
MPNERASNSRWDDERGKRNYVPYRKLEYRAGPEQRDCVRRLRHDRRHRPTEPPAELGEINAPAVEAEAPGSDRDQKSAATTRQPK